jgi:DNA replication protein DnaC
VDFREIYEDMKERGMKVPSRRINFGILDAKTVLENCFKYFFSFQNVNFEWQPEYDEVAAWLENNEGDGLLLSGSCGKGKSMLARYVIPAILLKYCKRIVSVYDFQEMNANIDAVLSKHLISIDEVGMESTIYNYGNKRSAFFEVMDAVEKYGKLVIISTNLSKDEIIDRYGERVYERIIATTRRIEFKGKSLRR